MMKNWLAVVAGACFSLGVMAEELPEAARKIIPDLEAWGATPEVVSAVKEQNAQHLTLDLIKERDATWRATPGVDDFMKGLMESPAAKKLSELEQSKPYFLEVFVMDNQGANVALTNKTSDYWQGDEAKFTESFKGGAGAVHIGEIEFDKSAQQYLVQISVPVKDGDQVIGAMTIGINLDEMK